MSRFGASYYQKYQSAGNMVRSIARDKLKLSPKVAALFRFIRGLPQGALVLDVGCGTGGLLELIERERSDLSTYGVDIGTPPMYRPKGQFAHASAFELPFPDNSFDLVTCAHVIEHLQDPMPALKEFVRVCKPQGAIYIETPSQRAALMPFGFSFWDDPTHVRPYTTVSLEWLLKDVGLVEVKRGVKRSMAGVFFGIPYMIVGSFMGDDQAKYFFPTYLLGLFVYAIGIKKDEFFK
jgi:ubiquinone/menaquinone biosynthesis C-methylase UbiE